MSRDCVGELDNLKFQYSNLRTCLEKMQAHPEKFSDKKEVKELQFLMSMALQTLEYRIKELDRIVPMQGNFKK